MRDENYYRDKQARSDARNTVGAIHKSHTIIKNAMARLALFFTPPKAKHFRLAAETQKITSIKNHKRTIKQRLIRRQKHTSRMRNAA